MLQSSMPYLIDTHCHLNFKAFSDDAKQAILRAKEAGVLKVIVVGADLETSKRAVDLASKNDGVYAAVGFHPVHLEKLDFSKDEDDWVVGEVRKLLKKEKVVALGEIGLDYFREPYNKSRQKDFLLKLLDEAVAANKPAILHCRDAYEDMWQILEPFSGNLKGVMHCFNGNVDQLRKFVQVGLSFGFTGQVTYENKDEMKDVIRELELGKILIETDSPYLSPVPKRGERNEPANVKYVAEEVAKIKGINAIEVAKMTSENAEQLFDL